MKFVRHSLCLEKVHSAIRLTLIKMENQRRKRKAFTVKEKLEAIEHGTLLEIKCFGLSQFFFFELSFYSIQAERLKILTISAVLLIRFLLLD